MRTALLAVIAALLGFAVVRWLAPLPARPAAGELSGVRAPAVPSAVDGRTGEPTRRWPRPSRPVSVASPGAGGSALDLERLRAEDPGAWSTFAEGVDRALARLVIGAVEVHGDALSLVGCRGDGDAVVSIELDLDVKAEPSVLVVDNLRPALDQPGAWNEPCVRALLAGHGEASDVEVEGPFPELSITTRATLPVELGRHFASAITR